MSTFTGGKLKLKGGDPLGVKKKKKKKSSAAADALAVVPADGDAAGGSGSGDAQQAKDGSAAEPAKTVDRRTEAEKKAEAHFLKYEEQRAKKAAAKSHRDKIKELNDKLASLTEHHDLFNVSYTH